MIYEKISSIFYRIFSIKTWYVRLNEKVTMSLGEYIFLWLLIETYYNRILCSALLLFNVIYELARRCCNTRYGKHKNDFYIIWLYKKIICIAESFFTVSVSVSVKCLQFFTINFMSLQMEIRFINVLI